MTSAIRLEFDPSDSPHVEVYLTVTDVATTLGVDEATIKRWIHAGSLPAFRFGKNFRISSVELTEFIEDSRVDPLTAGVDDA